MMAERKTVLVTGATRGIGLEFARLYQKNGWNVIGAARDLTKADEFKALAPYRLVQLDTNDEASILNAANVLQGEAIDLLINNAGVMKYDRLETVTKAWLMKQFEVNSVGPFLVTRAFLPNLRAAVAKHGSALVAHMSSFLGSITCNDGTEGRGIYGYRTSKAALNMINSCLALDLKKHKIISVSLHPGLVSTDMTNHTGTSSADESVAALVEVLADLDLEDSGKFFKFNGMTLPW